MPSDQAPAQFPEPPPPGRDWAVFLDVDGCLLEIAARPDEVVVAPDLVPALAQLRERLNGAVALVSGRSLAHLDALFSPLHLAAAGQHGLERRDATGRLLPLAILPAHFAEVEARLALTRAHRSLHDHEAHAIVRGRHQKTFRERLLRTEGHTRVRGESKIALRPDSDVQDGVDRGTVGPHTYDLHANRRARGDRRTGQGFAMDGRVAEQTPRPRGVDAARILLSRSQIDRRGEGAQEDTGSVVASSTPECRWAMKSTMDPARNDIDNARIISALGIRRASM